MGNVAERVREAGLILGGLGVLGFIGVIWLMIYGNLNGNLGFGQDSLSPVNDTITLDLPGEIPSTADNRQNGAISSVVMTNTTGGEVIPATNYTVTGVTIATSGPGQYNGTGVSVSYNLAFDEQGKVNTDGVINNITGGFSTFFGFSNTFFTIAAIVLLIFMLVGLLAIVMTIAQGGKGKNAFSG